MKFAIVTGGSGFIGEHLVRRMLDEGWYVINIDRVNNVSLDSYKDRYINVNCDCSVLDTTLIQWTNPPDVIIHLAARHKVRESLVDPVGFLSDNLKSTLSVLNYASSWKDSIPKIVFASSAAVYGNRVDRTSVRWAEWHDKVPVNAYGLSKLMGEQMLSYVPHTSLRFFNVAGPGYRDSNPTHIVPRIIYDILRGNTVIINRDIRGRQIERDYVHVADVVDAIMLAAEKPALNCSVNICSGIKTTNEQVFDAIVSEMGIIPQSITGGCNDPISLVGDNALAKRLLGWEPKLSTISQIVKDAYAWEKP